MSLGNLQLGAKLQSLVLK